MSDKTSTAVLAGGCFWCMEAVFVGLNGIESVQSGYSGGTVADPSYEQVCTGATGHAEAVRLEFDPSVVSYADILRVFFTMHDPTTKDRQGNDIGPQYRSAVFYLDDQQRETAEAVMREIGESGIYGAALVTELEPLKNFYPAEEYHDDYFARNPRQPYCAAVIAPKVAKFRKLYLDRLRPGYA